VRELLLVARLMSRRPSKVRWNCRTAIHHQSHFLACPAARRAFETFSETAPAYRKELLDKIAAGIKKRMPEMADLITSEMGAPKWLANAAQAPASLSGFMGMSRILDNCGFWAWEGIDLLWC
jgi:aldehyde dehydrogenase (NAD+)